MRTIVCNRELALAVYVSGYGRTAVRDNVCAPPQGSGDVRPLSRSFSISDFTLRDSHHFSNLIAPMAKHTSVHDAWEDDWESLADKADAQPDPPAAANPPKISKAERLAKHAEINRQIWQSAYANSRYQSILHMPWLIII